MFLEKKFLNSANKEGAGVASAHTNLLSMRNSRFCAYLDCAKAILKKLLASAHSQNAQKPLPYGPNLKSLFYKIFISARRLTI